MKFEYQGKSYFLGAFIAFIIVAIIILLDESMIKVGSVLGAFYCMLRMFYEMWITNIGGHLR